SGPFVAQGNDPFILPLTRTWEIGLESSERLLAPASTTSRLGADLHIFSSAPLEQGGRLTCRNLSTGSHCWSANLSFVPSWLCNESGVLLIGGTGGVARVHPASGRLLWIFPASALFSAFQSDGSRLFLLENRERLIAVDAATGEVQWTRWAPGAGLGMQ